MKLLYILNIANRVNSFSYTSMVAARALGYEFHIAGNWNYKSLDELKEDEKKYGIHIHQIDFARNPLSPDNYKAYKQLYNLISELDFDGIHCNTPIGGVLGRLCGKKCGVKKVVYQAHGFHFYKGAPLINWLIYYPIERLLALFTDAIITINHEDYILAKKFKLRKSGKVYYIPGVGIDTKEFTQVNVNVSQKRAELGMTDSNVMMISAGELNQNKNNSAIIKAMAKANNPKVHYFLCGKGELENELRELAKNYGISDNVHFLGYRKEIKELLKSSDIFVLPSFREGLSRSLMEAMASGLPCIVSDIRGNSDLIKTGINGYLCNASDIDAFSEAINTLASDASLRKKISTQNLEDIKDYDVELVAKKMTEIYSEQFI